MDCTCCCNDKEPSYKVVTKYDSIDGGRRHLVARTRSGERGTSRAVARKRARKKRRR